MKKIIIISAILIVLPWNSHCQGKDRLCQFVDSVYVRYRALEGDKSIIASPISLSPTQNFIVSSVNFLYNTGRWSKNRGWQDNRKRVSGCHGVKTIYS